MKVRDLAVALALGVLAPSALLAVPLCPAVGIASDCNIVLTITPGGTLTPSAGASVATTYDGADDVLVGVINNSGHAISSITLDGGGIDIFGFDGDGIDAFGVTENAGNPDSTGYGGPNGYFTGISSSFSIGTVNFIAPLAGNGGFDYFSLEEAITFDQITGNPGGPSSVTPEPSALLMLGTGIAGLVGGLRRRIFN
jgi:hypothetical protein